MASNTVNKAEVVSIVKEMVEQIAQQAAQQAVEQTLQAAQQTGGSLRADKKVLGADYVTEDTGSDEAVKGKTYVDSELWGANKKLIFAHELDTQRALNQLAIKERQLQVDEREAKLRHQAQLDAIATSEAQQSLNFKHILNMEYAKFNAAISEPIAPNTADSASKGKKK